MYVPVLVDKTLYNKLLLIRNQEYTRSPVSLGCNRIVHQRYHSWCYCRRDPAINTVVLRAFLLYYWFRVIGFGAWILDLFTLVLLPFAAKTRIRCVEEVSSMLGETLKARFYGFRLWGSNPVSGRVISELAFCV